MNIIISNADNRPIYEQIIRQIKALIAGGKLAENELLPSIRNLARDLRISVITTKRAYDELEAEGYLYSLPGKGFYVAKKNLALIREAELKKIEEHLRAVLEIAAVNGITATEIKEMFQIISGEEDHERN